MGDPTGVGSELVLRARQAYQNRAYQHQAHQHRDICFAVMDRPERLQKWAKQSNCAVRVIEISSWDEAPAAFEEGLPVLPLSEKLTTIYGDSPQEPKALRLTQESIETGYLAAKNGEVDGLLTNPIDKSILIASDHWHAQGHTDFLCSLDRCQPGDVVMMLEGGDLQGDILRVVPATIHVPLWQAIQDVSTSLIVKTVTTTIEHLQRVQHISNPKIAVSGLNPHAGEGGALGLEEQKEIEPAIKILQEKGYHVAGPFSADTLFIPEKRQQYDAFVTMTHDQALIAVKTLYFYQCVNVTLGLSILRTSPAHGVARDIAGKNTASLSSWQQALLWFANGHLPKKNNLQYG